jgi:hypothetical protein
MEAKLNKTSRLFMALVPVGAALPIIFGLLLAFSGSSPAAAKSLAAPPFPDQRDSLAAAVGWLMGTAQNSDGGFKEFGSDTAPGPSDAPGAIQATLALYSAGFNPAKDYVGRSKSVVDWMDDNPAELAAHAAKSGGASGHVVMALVAACQDPRNFHGYNFVISLTSRFSPTTGYYDDTEGVSPFRQALAILGLASVSQTVPATATQWLTTSQVSGGADDGCWLSWGTCSVDDTATAIMALVAAGVPKTDTNVVSATNYLSRTQATSGGWESWGAFSVNSTALALQALAAQGEDFYSTSGKWARGGNTPLSALLEAQNSGGQWATAWNPGGDNYATFGAIPAVAGKPFPLKGRCEAARRGLLCLKTVQNGDASFPEFGGGFGEKANGTARAIESISMCNFPHDPQLTDPQSAYWTENSMRPIEALSNTTPAYLSGAQGGRVGEVMRGVVRSDSPYTVTSFAGLNLVISMTDNLLPNGQYDNLYGQPNAMLGLAYSGRPISPTATTWLLDQKSGGSWNDDNALTGQALQALAAGGQTDVVSKLRSNQLNTGAWASSGGPSVDSTAEVVKGLTAHNENPHRPSWSKVVSGTVTSPVDWVLSQQNADGCWYNSGEKDPYQITDAIMMLCSDYPWPIRTHYMPIMYRKY